MKRVTFKGRIYLVEKVRLKNGEVAYQLSNGEWAEKKDTTHWLAGWFNMFFSSKKVSIVINILIVLFVVLQLLRFNGIISIP
jgi:hypothetical protein